MMLGEQDKTGSTVSKVQTKLNSLTNIQHVGRNLFCLNGRMGKKIQQHLEAVVHTMPSFIIGPKP